MREKRAILRIQLDSSGKEHLDRLCDQRGMTQIAIMSRLMEWFVQQDQIIQLSVLRLLPAELAAPAARQILERLSAAGSTRKANG